MICLFLWFQVHSFDGSEEEMEAAVEFGLYVGVNGWWVEARVLWLKHYEVIHAISLYEHVYLLCTRNLLEQSLLPTFWLSASLPYWYCHNFKVLICFKRVWHPVFSAPSPTSSWLFIAPYLTLFSNAWVGVEVNCLYVLPFYCFIMSLDGVCLSLCLFVVP